MLTAVVMLSLIIFPTFEQARSDTRPVTVYFTRDGEPHDKPVAFTIRCYRAGWYSTDGSGGPREAYYDSVDCPHYGCEVILLSEYSLHPYASCDCEGETEGQEFIIRDYGSSPFECEHFFACELKLEIPVSAEFSTSDSDGGGGGGG